MSRDTICLALWVFTVTMLTLSVCTLVRGQTISAAPSLNKIILSSIGSATSAVLPANAYISQVVVQNTTSNAITGGLKFGTTNGGVDIAAAMAVGANAFAAMTDATLLKRVFSTTATQTIFIDTVTLWNGAVVNIEIIYGYL